VLERLFALEHFGVKLGLDNIRTLCAALDHPERAFPVIHVAGTNGKGSVTAMVHAIYQAAGLHAARFTSPHLTDLRERFVMGRDAVDAETLGQAAGDVLDCADRLRHTGTLPVHPTFFEATTAIAFELFRRAKVDVAIVEVGLGGRFDSTNVVRPIVGAITSIGFDHEQYLGHSLEAIAFEKAGIIKPGMAVVAGALPEEASRVVETVAAQQQARLVRAHDGTDVIVESETGRLTLRTPDGGYGPFRLALRGDHQVGNALTAVRVVESARHHGLPLSRTAVERGLADVEWPGRLELIQLPEGAVLLDAAHNPDGARALAAFLGQCGRERPTFVIGLMRDKDLRAVLDALLPHAASIIATAADTPRALPAQALAAGVRTAAPALPVDVEPDPLAAVAKALSRSPFVCVTGSIFLVGAVREHCKRRAILRESSDSR
jgi:dihydrofolate synthase/folylpolyglutamate synthase